MSKMSSSLFEKSEKIPFLSIIDYEQNELFFKVIW